MLSATTRKSFTMVALVFFALFSCYLVSVTHSTRESLEVQTCSSDNDDLCVSAAEMPQAETEFLVESVDAAEEDEDTSYDPLNEDERKLAYASRNYTWPPKIVPDTPGWNKLMMRRFRQLEFLEDASQRWQGYLNLVTCMWFIWWYLWMSPCVLHVMCKQVENSLLTIYSLPILFVLQLPLLLQILRRTAGV